MEILEDRLLLAAAAATPTYIVEHQAAHPTYASSAVGLTPSQVATAYGINQISLNGIVGNGAGQTIAIVDAYDDPKFVNSTDPGFVNSDLHQFDLAMGLPDPPSFRKVAQDGSNNYPQQNAGWDGEIALDVEWAHALAPQANIILVEANSNYYSDLIAAAENWARQQPGVSVVSMSFGGSEFTGETSYDSYFTTPAGHNGVTFVASTGDSGAPGGYPAYSPNVLAVGGTSLSVGSGGSYGGESAWSSGGGGLSTQESQPSYQRGVVTQSSTQRAIPDVSFDADPASGVSVYDTVNNSASSPWWQVGGTSLSAPCWAALLAITNQLRVSNGLSTLDGPSQTLPAIYSLPQSDFHDVVSGNNGYAAGTGYDLATGRGTPLANLLVADLSGVPRISFATVDVPGTGLARYSNVTGWQTLNSNDASMIATDANGNVAAAFPGNGLWRDTASGWQQLTATAPLMISMDGAGDVFGGFGTGVWRYSTAGGWQQLSGDLPSHLDADANGDVVGVFATGVWRYTVGSSWQQLNTPSSLSGAVATLVGMDGSGNVVAEFSGHGVWEYTSAGRWTQIRSSDASLLAVDAAGDVAVSSPTSGVWYYTASKSTWAQITSTAAVRLSIDMVGAVVTEFVGTGVWQYKPGSGWKQLTTSNASLVAENAGGDSDAGDDIASSVKGSGVWRYTDVGGWKQLTAASATWIAANSVGDVVAEIGGAICRYRDATGWTQLKTANATHLGLDAAGDVFAEIPGSGVWRYTDAAGWQPLTGDDASTLAVNANGDVAATYSTGVWRYTSSTGWQLLTATPATQVTIDGAGDVGGSFGTGVWRYTDSTRWQQLTSSVASQISMDAAGDVTGEFSGHGVWRFTNNTNWQQLSTADATFVLMNTSGTVVAQYGGSTLYHYLLRSVTGQSFTSMIASVLASDASSAAAG